MNKNKTIGKTKFMNYNTLMELGFIRLDLVIPNSKIIFVLIK